MPEPAQDLAAACLPTEVVHVAAQTVTPHGTARRPRERLRLRPEPTQDRGELPPDLHGLPLLDFDSEHFDNQVPDADGRAEARHLRITIVEEQRPMACKRTGTEVAGAARGAGRLGALPGELVHGKRP